MRRIFYLDTPVKQQTQRLPSLNVFNDYRINSKNNDVNTSLHYKKKTRLLIDMTVPSDRNLSFEEHEN